MSQIDFAALPSQIQGSCSSRAAVMEGFLQLPPSCRPPPQLGTFQSYRNFLQLEASWNSSAHCPCSLGPQVFLPLMFSDLSCPFKHFTWTAARRSASTRAHLKLLGVCKQIGTSQQRNKKMRGAKVYHCLLYIMIQWDQYNTLFAIKLVSCRTVVVLETFAWPQ